MIKLVKTTHDNFNPYYRICFEDNVFNFELSGDVVKAQSGEYIVEIRYSVSLLFRKYFKTLKKAQTWLEDNEWHFRKTAENIWTEVHHYQYDVIRYYSRIEPRY